MFLSFNNYIWNNNNLTLLKHKNDQDLSQTEENYRISKPEDGYDAEVNKKIKKINKIKN